MATPGVTTTVTELPESRVRVEAEVAPEELDRKLSSAAKRLGRSLRIPGFRAGKVPPPIVIQRVGREAVLDEAVRDGLGQWYAAAIDEAKIVPVGEPDLDLSELPGEGEPLRFTIEIGVRPTAKLGKYKGLEVGKADANVEDADIEAELERLREQGARLETAERPAQEGDYVVISYVGSIDGVPFAGGEGRDQPVMLGGGRLVPGFEEQLTGATGGDERTVTITFPADYGAAELAGKEAQFAVTVKEVKEKVLPELDEDFAIEQGFDSIEELTEDIRARLAEALTEGIESDFRRVALDAAVANATVDVPAALTTARARELWDQMAHSLSHQGIDRATYLKIAGKTEEEVIEEAKPDAAEQLKREAVLAAIIEAEGIEPSDEDLMRAMEPSAQREGTTPKKLLEKIRSAGRLDTLREDLATSKALDVVVDSAKAITIEQAQARDKLWTPGRSEQAAGTAGGLIKPGD